MKLYIFFLTLLFLVLSGCAKNTVQTVSTDINATGYVAKKQMVSLQKRIRIVKKIRQNWWSAFGSHTLDDLVNEALLHNYTIQDAKLKLQAAQESVQIAHSDALPHLDLEALAGRQRYGVSLFGPSNFTIPPFSYYEFGAALSWSPDIFGSTKLRVEMQRFFEHYQIQQIKALYINLSSDVVTCTLHLSATRKKIVLRKQIIIYDKKILSLVRFAVTIGQAQSSDVLQAQTQLDEDSASLPLLKQQKNVLEHTLLVLLAKTPDQSGTIKKLDFDTLHYPQTIPLKLPSTLLLSRPDIVAAQDRVHASQAAFDIAKANLYPHITLQADMMLEALKPENIFNVASNAWSLVAQLSAPIFDGGKLHAQKRKEKALYDASLSQYKQTILQAFKEVADALTAIKHDQSSALIAKRTLKDANDAYAIARERYLAGDVGEISLLRAKRSYALAKIQNTDTLQNMLIDYDRLLSTLGGSKEFTFGK
jgi:NodT family efflux transporter outer membrane factor (OMF) lipoprotein